MDQSGQKIRRRAVFYIPGFDPFPPRRYRELYRKEGAEQGQISGYHLSLTPAQKTHGFGWKVQAEIQGQTTQADMTVLTWADIVQDSMAQSISATYLQMLKTAWIYLRSGALFRLMQMRKGPVIAALYPVVILLGQLVIALSVGGVLASLFASLAPSSLAVSWLAVLVFLGAVWAVLRAFKGIDHKIYAYYLMHDYAFSAQLWGATPPALEQRLQAFADQIKAAHQSDYDEVLIVGHSSGAHLAVAIVASLLRGGVAGQTPKLSLLTLGQVAPMVSFLPRATDLRRDLAYLSDHSGLTWVDVSAPGDGCCFALCDPVAVSGIAGAQKKWPLVLSAAFTNTLSAERWRQLRWRFFRLHFQYLCAFDRPGDYDYFQITAGPMSLSERFAGRAPSASRIETPLSRYRDIGE